MNSGAAPSEPFGLEFLEHTRARPSGKALLFRVTKRYLI